MLTGARTPAPACCPRSSQRWTASSQPQVGSLQAPHLQTLAKPHDDGQMHCISCRKSALSHQKIPVLWLHWIRVLPSDSRLRSTGVVVLAATNRADVLDAALMRPGRFDVQLHVPLPDLASRKAILDVHTRGMPLQPTVDLQVIMPCYVYVHAFGLASAGSRHPKVEQHLCFLTSLVFLGAT